MKILGKTVTIRKHLVKDGELPQRKGFNIDRMYCRDCESCANSGIGFGMSHLCHR